MAFKPFEKSKKDVESKKRGAEGSKKEEAFDMKQKRGFAKGGLMRGTGAATKGKRFAGDC